MAIDVAPAKFFKMTKDTGEDLAPGLTRDYFSRVAERTQVSFVTAKGADADKSLRMAVGVQATLMDETDPYLKVGDALDSVQSEFDAAWLEVQHCVSSSAANPPRFHQRGATAGTTIPPGTSARPRPSFAKWRQRREFSHGRFRRVLDLFLALKDWTT